MKESIFHTTVEMPPKSNSPDVERTALTRGEMQRNLTPASFEREAGTRNLPPPKRGCHY